MRIALVTTCRDPGILLRETVASVLSVRMPHGAGVAIDYRVVDAASSDGTVRFLQDLQPPPGMRFSWTSRPDASMYEGLAEGFAHVDGDLFGYVNAGDLVAPGLHRVLSSVMGEHPTIEWMTGYDVHHTAEGDVFRVDLPPRYDGRLLRAGAYGRILPSVQQESTFWSARMMAAVELEELARFRLAGDAYLWSRFAEELADRRFPLTVVRAHLGGSRHHADRLSHRRDESGSRAYLTEMQELIGPIRRGDRMRAWRERRVWRRSGHSRWRKTVPQATVVVDAAGAARTTWPKAHRHHPGALLRRRTSG